VARTPRILLVDDELQLLEIAKQFLILSLDSEIDTTESAVDGLKKVKQQHYDAIVSDYQMPEMNGIEFLRQVAEIDDRVPFILFTGKGREEVAIEAINSGADFYIKKGGDAKAQFAELANAINQAIARRQAERAHAESQERFWSLYNQMHDLVFVVDLDANFLDVNPAALQLFGYKQEEIGSTNLMKLLDPEDVPTALAQMVELMETGTYKKRSEYRVNRRDGTSVEVEVSASLLYRNGQPYAIQGVARDITERKRAEAELRLQRDMAERYLNLAGFMFVALDEQGRITLLNHKGCQLLGWSQDAPPIGLSWFDEFVPSGVRDQTKAVFQQLIRGEVAPTEYYENPVVTKQGEERLIAWHNTVLHDDAGKIVGTLSSGEDITDRKMAVDAITEANRKLNLLTRITSHDIQNQLVVLNGLINRARREQGHVAVREYLARMQHAADKIQSQLSFAHEYQSLGKAPPDWHRLDECLGDLVSRFDSKYIQLDMDGGAWEVYSDAMLNRVFYNLVDNTIRHGQKATKVWISAQERNGTLVVRYEDNGAGIPTDLKRAIFELRSTDPRPHGLMMVKEILAITGITIEEKGVPGEGALFELSVPKGAYRTSPAPG
jgi:PAS domain S-box-containing protein